MKSHTKPMFETTNQIRVQPLHLPQAPSSLDPRSSPAVATWTAAAGPSRVKTRRLSLRKWRISVLMWFSWDFNGIKPFYVIY